MLSRTDTTPSKCQRESTVQEACKWRSRLSLHCCRGWSSNVMRLEKSDRSEQHLIWCCGVMSLVDYSSQLRRKGKSVPIGPNPAVKATHEFSHTSLRNWCGYCVRARAADDPHHRQPLKEYSAHAGAARKRQAHFRSTEARGVIKELCTRAAGPPPNKFSVKPAYLQAKWIIRYEDDHTCDKPQSNSVAAMNLKIKDLDYMKKLGQQSRTTSTHSLVLSKEPGTRLAE